MSNEDTNGGPPEGGPPESGTSGLDGEESLIRFPAELTVKAMGLAEVSEGPEFQALIESLILPLIAPASAQRIDTRESSGGKYLSVRVHFTATSQAQLEAIYAALHVEPRVLYTL